MRADAVERVDTGGIVLLLLAAWLVPGSGHLWLGRRAKGLVFLVVLAAMFGIGLALQGRLFPFETSQPLVFLAAAADVAAGLPYFAAWALGWDRARWLPSPTSTRTRSSSSRVS